MAMSSGSRRTEKQPTGRGPEGCVENGPAAALLVGYVPHHFTLRSGFLPPVQKWCGMRPPRALPATHFERNDVITISETVH